MNQKTVEKTDADIGTRVRAARMAMHRSQEWLGEAVGVTFQQIQKYEKGTNRIGGSRLQKIANALNVTPSQLFGEEGQENSIPAFDNETLKAARAFSAISSPKARMAILKLMVAMGGHVITGTIEPVERIGGAVNVKANDESGMSAGFGY